MMCRLKRRMWGWWDNKMGEQCTRIQQCINTRRYIQELWKIHVLWHESILNLKHRWIHYKSVIHTCCSDRNPNMQLGIVCKFAKHFKETQDYMKKAWKSSHKTKLKLAENQVYEQVYIKSTNKQHKAQTNDCTWNTSNVQMSCAGLWTKETWKPKRKKSATGGGRNPWSQGPTEKSEKQENTCNG
jgi:hypothetical protein